MKFDTRRIMTKAVAVTALFCMTMQTTFAALLNLATDPLSVTQVPPKVMLAISKDQQLYKKAYNDYTDLDGDGTIDTNYKHTIEYYGYFDPFKCYKYSSDRFEPAAKSSDKLCDGSTWSGNFLNWVAMSRIDYSTVLFLVGVIYVLLSRFRSSDLYAAAAAIAGNAGLWALWHEQGTTLVQHPQIWLIPPAVCALVAAQLNQSRLKPEQLTAVRYAAMILIYVSSAGEMFITGVADSLLMPMVLAALSVAGAFVGILLRVRAFLYLGTSFLGLAILSMVAHASQNIHHVWPWWTFGITLGLALLTAFATFERHRPAVLQMLDDLQQWEQ